jgi:NhaA family Na+:H+ antiporter
VVLKEPILSKEQLHQVDNLSDWTGKYQSPLQKLEHSLHGWVAYFIIPVFALANAGVLISGDIDLDTDIMRNIIISLVLGNSIGITTLVLLAKKAKLIEVPKDISNRQIVGVSFLAGIGFTMAIFIASLALDSSPLFLDSAKIGVLIGSLISAIIGLLILNSKKTKTT